MIAFWGLEAIVNTAVEQGCVEEAVVSSDGKPETHFVEKSLSIDLFKIGIKVGGLKF